MNKAKHKDREATKKRLLADLRRKIVIGTKQADRGELLDGEAVFTRLLQRSEKRRRSRG